MKHDAAKDDRRFVKRPSIVYRNGKSKLDLLIQTAENGMAIEITSLGNYSSILKSRGYRMHSSIKGASSKGGRICWAEKIADATQAAPDAREKSQ